ncbi:LysR substrate-binding domain-containing protein [Yoonia sp.]|uniref:LysR family transcriptional regulator n=1 Tax=Yoonia sp. TaxID=2212373 RepID=UPI0023B3AECF
MILEGIDVFTEVVDAKSFSTAARRLGMPTSTVSAKIARLEERLGTTLIQRTTRQLHVTPSGEAYYQRCIRAVNEMAAAERELADASQAPTGLLKISVPGDIAQFKLVPVVEAFLARYPKTSVDLNITNTRVDLIAEGIDLAIRVGALEDSTLVVRRFSEARLGLWASQDYLDKHGTPQTPRDLLTHSTVQMTQARDLMQLSDNHGNDISLMRSNCIMCDDIQTVRTFVETGAGIGFLPDFAGAYTLRPLVQILPDVTGPPAPLSFVYPSQRYVPQNVRAFIDLAKSIETS